MPGPAARAVAMPEIEELNSLPIEGCVTSLAPLFEGAPRFLAALCERRPFDAWDDVFRKAEAVAAALIEADQIELLDAHPRLGASPASVSVLSHREQGYDRADRAAPAEGGRLADELARLNEAYETRFGFRYCVFVAGREQAALIPGFRAALEAERSSELRRGIGDVLAIARDRQRSLSAKAKAARTAADGRRPDGSSAGSRP